MFTRRGLMIGAGAVSSMALAGCSKTTSKFNSRISKKATNETIDYKVAYGALPNEQFPLEAANISEVPEKYYRRRVKYKTDEKPGTIVVDTSNFYLYLVEPRGKAMRYGVGLGKAGFEWSGRARVLWKQKWPKWTPPEEMIARRPELAKWGEKNGGMPPGLNNPLGSRALYIFEGNVDTLYRIHGTPEYWSIGKAVSSGCVRMINQDVIDLYDRVRTKAEIVVL